MSVNDLFISPTDEFRPLNVNGPRKIGLVRGPSIDSATLKKRFGGEQKLVPVTFEVEDDITGKVEVVEL
jgi:hypothetical protein